ncbi:DUF4328 domain-containing protein [Nocardioides baculatus]|uniref:DUF4328 domain-containing protein n=1 Tax=Nocardioides baculatus TaxID=2801337 RepID=A0ABS1LDV3_9ACTN|nr:DUF4328 domain-containing protein [Nocardioides baculatus]MBL0748701.1 DUF4328 domain-containing protein [Nocardioides baculatus]
MTVSGEGWYADPQDPARLRWWDGSAWTMHTHDPGTTPGTHHAPLPRWWGGLGAALQAGLLVNLAMSLYVIYVDREILAFVEELRLRPDGVTDADGLRIDRLLLWSALEWVPWVGTGILFIVWTYTAHHSARMDRSVMRHGSGWAIGGWFVPLLNFWRPLQVVLDIRRGATGDEELPVTRTLGWWWVTFLVSYATSMIAGFHYRASESDDEGGQLLDHFAGAATWEQWSSVINIVCAVLAVRVVSEVRSLVRAEPT